MKAFTGQLGDADIRLLRVFLSVVACRGFAQAGLELGLGASTVSTHIANLETRLGLTLCRRGRGGFSLTEEGRAIRDEAQRLFAALDRFQSHINAAHNQLAGDFNLGMVDHVMTLPQIDVPNVIRRFRETAPNVHVSVQVLALDDIERRLLDGRLHAAVVARYEDRRELTYRPLAREVQRLYCGRNHPLFSRDDAEINHNDLRIHHMVGRTYLDETKAKDRVIDVRPITGANNLEATLILILSGAYLGMLPEQYAAPWVSDGKIRPLAADLRQIEKDFALAVRKSDETRPLLRAFLKCW